MARNIWDVSDILLQQRAGDIQGNMFANLGQQAGNAFQQYGERKKQNKAMEGEIGSTIKFLESARDMVKDDPRRSAQIDQTLAQLHDPNVNLIQRYSMAKGAGQNIVTLVNLGESVQKQQLLAAEEARRAKDIEAMRNFFANGAVNLSALSQAGSPETALRLAEAGKALTAKPANISDKDQLFNELNANWQAANPGKVMPQEIRTKNAQEAYGSKPPTTVLNMGEGAYNKTVGEEMAKKDVADMSAAESAVSNIEKLYDVMDILEKGDPSTGVFSELQNNINRVRAKFMSDQKAGKSVRDTEILDALLGSDVFPQIQALGIGARGLDTPAERDYLRKVMTGTIDLNSESLKKLADIRVSLQKRAIEKVNKRIEGGEYDKFYEVSGRKKNMFSIPERAKQESVQQTQFVDGQVYQDKDGNKAKYQNGQWIPL